jgi:hypothetical protein
MPTRTAAPAASSYYTPGDARVFARKHKVLCDKELTVKIQVLDLHRMQKRDPRGARPAPEPFNRPRIRTRDWYT